MHPVLLIIGPVTVYSYGLFLALGFFISLYLFWRFLKEELLEDDEKILDFAVVVVIFGLLGGSVDPIYLFLAVGAAQSPDLLESPYFIFNQNLAPCVWIYNLQHKLHWRIGLPWGLVTQVIFILIVLWLLNTPVIY